VADLWVDPVALQRVGGSIQGVAQQLGYVLPANTSSVVTPAGDGSGWLAWSAMTIVGRLWSEELASLTGAVADLGQRVVTAAQNYSGVDQASADSFASGL
jgi:Excreted virulence factor EspC, type VII ESX diderm